MWIKFRIIDVIGTAKITDEEMIQEAGRELTDLVEAAAETKKLLLSFEGVEVMSSAMIFKLVLLNKLAKPCGVKLRFCDISPNVLEVFKITKLNRVFRILSSEDDDDPDDDDGPGSAGVFAKLPKRPGSGGTHAEPPRDGS